MASNAAQIRGFADEVGFSGVVRLKKTADSSPVEFARGHADRANSRDNLLSTRFATASATKGLTALTVMSMIESELLTLGTPVREILLDQLPNVDESVTVEHLLSHTSGIGDYIDEEAPGDIDDHVLGVSAHTLETPLDYVPLLAPFPQVSAPGERFAYNNSGFVVLSMMIELVTGSFHDAVRERVLEPAGMDRSGFFRSDELPADTALGYIEDGRTNVFHLPVIGGGDGGVYVTLDDVSSLWDALFAGSIVSPDRAQEMTSIHNHWTEHRAYGLGFWMRPDGQVAWLEGMDPGVSFKSARNLRSGASYTVISNTSSGTWPVAKLLDSMLDQ